MRPAWRLALASLAASTAALVVGLLRGGSEILIIALAISTALALVGEARSWRWSPTLWFLAQAGLCAVARSGELWELISIAGALAYWDLSAFNRRLRNAGCLAQPGPMLQRHLVYLAGATALGFGLGTASDFIRIESDFAGALLLGVIALAGLFQLLQRAQAPTTQLGKWESRQAGRNS